MSWLSQTNSGDEARDAAVGTQYGGEYQNISYTDLVSEGPIWGLVDGANSVYFDDNPGEEGKYAAYRPKRVTAEVTFNGSSNTGTFDNDVNFNADFTMGQGRELITVPHKRFTVSITSKSSSNSGMTFGLQTNSSTPSPFNFSSSVFNSTSSSTFSRIAALTVLFSTGSIKRFSFQGTLSVIDSANASMEVALNSLSKGMYDNIVVNTTIAYITIIENREITNLNTTARQVTVSGSTPPAQSSLFWLTDSHTFNSAVATGTNVDTTLSSGSFIGKIDDLIVQETFGTVDQYALPRIQNVGGSVAVIGPPNNAQQIRMFDYREMGNLPANHVGLVTQPIEPQHLDEQRGEEIPYDDTERFSVDFGPSDFGLSGVQIDLADTIQFDILYPQGLIYFGGDGSPNYYYMTAMYNVILELYTGGSSTPRNTINLYPDSLMHRGRRQGPLLFTHEVDLHQFRNLYGPFTSFQIHFYRYTRHRGATMKADGTRANKDTKYWQVLATAQITNLGATFQDKLTYPNSALINSVFSSRQFKTAPKRSFDVKGRLIKVPSTYTPREYSDTGLAKYQGFWDGTFVDNVYTDNPAWIFYDLITNGRYGAGTWIDSSVVDKYALYRIAKYCDELVPASEEINAALFEVDEFYEIRNVSSQTQWNDMARTTGVTYAVGDLIRVLQPGPTGTTSTGVRYEPRFRMNLYLTKAEAVYKVIKDVASAFTSILYWMDGHLTLLQDAPGNSIHTFTKSNVIDGKFAYQTTPAKLRPNQFIVYFNDPKTNYSLTPVMYEDPVAIVKQGKVINKSANAFGCTSESQAIRYAKWKLWTAQNQKEIVIFQTGLQGNYVRPGDIIGVQDASRQNVIYSGRVSTSTLTTLTFDRQVRFNGNSTYYLNVMFSKPAATYVGYDPVTINGTTYSKGDYIPEAYIRTAGGAYVLATLDTEEKASNAFKDTTSEDLLAVTWKKYTHVRQYPIDNPASAGAFLHEDIVTLASGEIFEDNVADGSVWSLFETAASGETVLGSEKIYKVITVAQDEKNIYSIQAVEHSNAKFDAVDTDYELGNIPPSIFPEVEPEEVPPPINLRIKPFSDNVAELFKEFQLQWDPPDTIYIAAYEVSASPNLFEDEVTIKLVGDTSITFKDVPQGKYSFKVRTVSPKQNVSEWVTFTLDYGEALDENGDPIGVIDDSIERIHGLPVWAHSNTEGRIKSESAIAASTTNLYQVTNRWGSSNTGLGYWSGNINMPIVTNIAAGDYYLLEIKVTNTNINYISNGWKSQTWVWNGERLGDPPIYSRFGLNVSDTLVFNGEEYKKGDLEEGPNSYTVGQLTLEWSVYALQGETIQGQEGYEVWTFDSFDAELASYGSPSSYATITEASGNGVVTLSGVADGDDRELYIIFDHSAPKIFLAYYDTDLHPTAGGLWRDIGNGTNPINLTYTPITGSANIAANSTTLTGTNTLFTTEVQIGDFISLSNAASAAAIPTPSSAVKVLAINSDTEILIDAAFQDAISVTNLYRSSYRPDYAKDAVIAFVERE
tara:strand:- start:1336 stop:5886 length:4551 start_codon:yes stop_codon:yes gene_type:complete